VSDSDWKTFELSALVERLERSTSPYLEFLRVPALSCGIYKLSAGAKDLQSPHDEDEVYFVISGKARISVDGEERRLGPGSILYVQATSEHSFVEIEEDVTLLVFFASGGPSGA
jgi:mannose-6-phosphate isomerase-like protein (cupin superfamily)